MEKKTSWMYKIIKGLVRLFYPRTEVVGTEHLPPDEPVIIVGNHAQLHGPVACELYFPGRRYIWCAGEMMHLKEVPDYAFQDFWSKKPKYIRWFFRVVSYVIAPIAVCVFNNANTIGVYHDKRILSTFKESAEALADGANVVVFPECYDPHNHIVYQFQEGFADIARLYNRKTGKEIQFVPMYVAPNLKKLVLGKPVRYCRDNPKQEERARICNYLMDEITNLACALPQHRVVPYPNMPKKDYPLNVSSEACHEKTGC